MLSELLSLGRDLGPRFRLVAALPGLTLVAFVWALVESGAPRDRPDLDRIADAVAGLSTWEAVFALLTVIIAGLLLEPLQIPLVRFLEGYWGPRLDWLSRPRAGVHDRRRAGLDAAGQRGDARAMARAVARYPPLNHPVLATSLGNALRSAERRAGERYGLDTVAAWPRLYPVLSDRVAAIVDDRRMQLDVATRFAVTFAVAAIISAALLVSHGWWLLVAAAAATLAAFAYRAAIEAAVGYADGLQVAFDLHRFDLLDALHLPLPPDLAYERLSNQRLTRWLVTNLGSPDPYVHPRDDL